WSPTYPSTGWLKPSGIVATTADADRQRDHASQRSCAGRAVAGVTRCQRRSRPLAPEHRHPENIAIGAVVPVVLPETTFLPETRLGVRGDGALIVGQYLQRHLAEIQVREGVLDQGADGVLS